MRFVTRSFYLQDRPLAPPGGHRLPPSVLVVGGLRSPNGARRPAIEDGSAPALMLLYWISIRCQKSMVDAPCRAHSSHIKSAPTCNRHSTISCTAPPGAYPHPHQVPALPAIYPDPHAILIPPSGEGGWGDCLLEECHRTADAIERWMLAVSEYLRRSEDRNPETS